MSGFSISGLGSGIDWSLYIDSIIQAEEAKIARTITTQQVEKQSQQVVYQNIRGALSGLQAAVRDFETSQDLKRKTTASSDSSILTATATNSAPVQSFDVTVVQVANNEEFKSSYESTEMIVQSGADTTITLTVRGQDRTVDVPSGTTLQELAGIINSANIGVTASVFDTKDGTATPVRLAIRDNALGDYDDGSGSPPDNIVFTDFSSALDGISTDPTVSVAAQNSQVTINGDDIYTSSLTVTGVIPGVTLNLKKADPNPPQTITVQEDTSNAAQSMGKLIDSYNSAVSLLRQATAFDPTQDQQTNPTAGDSTLRNVLTRLQDVFTTTITSLPESVSIRSLTEIGITTAFSGENTAANGTIQFDAAKFNAAIADNYDDLIKFFEGFTEESTRYDGWANRVGDIMESLLRTPDGTITSKISSLDQQIRDLNKEQIEAVERINQKEERLTSQFARLEAQLAGLNGQQSALSSALESIKLNNQAIAQK